MTRQELGELAIKAVVAYYESGDLDAVIEVYNEVKRREKQEASDVAEETSTLKSEIALEDEEKV